MKWTKQEKETLSSIWTAKSQEEILKQISRSWKSIKRQAERMCLKRIRGPYGAQWGKINPENIATPPSWLIGEMLGDGHVDIQGRYCHTTKYQEYAQFLRDKFLELDEAPAKIFPNQYLDKRTNKVYSRFMLKTRSVFKKLRSEWYQPTKIVPTTIQIDDAIFHHWIMGDGSITNNNTFRLATMGFDDNSLQILRSALLSYGLHTTVEKTKNIYIRRIKKNQEIVSRLIKYDWNCYNYKKERLQSWSQSVISRESVA